MRRDVLEPHDPPSQPRSLTGLLCCWWWCIVSTAWHSRMSRTQRGWAPPSVGRRLCTLRNRKWKLNASQVKATSECSWRGPRLPIPSHRIRPSCGGGPRVELHRINWIRGRDYIYYSLLLHYFHSRLRPFPKLISMQMMAPTTIAPLS